MMLTNPQYMSDEKRVERTVGRFQAIALSNLLRVQTRKYLEFMLEPMLKKEALSQEKLQNMPYIELACLIDNAGGNPLYDWTSHGSWMEQLYYYRCIAYVLIDGNKSFIPIKLFLALPLKAFYAYLDRASPGKGLLADFELLKSCCKYKEDYTIKDFLVEKTRETQKAWFPIEELEIYGEDMADTYKDIGRLLVDSFHKAFPIHFCIENIRKKYSASHSADNR